MREWIYSRERRSDMITLDVAPIWTYTYPIFIAIGVAILAVAGIVTAVIIIVRKKRKNK